MLEKFKKFIGISELEEDNDEIFLDEKNKEEKIRKNESENRRKNYYIEKINENKKNADIIIVKPRIYEDCAKIVDDLKRNKTVVLSLEELEIDFKKQIFEFVKGAVYALEANMQKASEDILIISPKNIEINGKIKINVNPKIL